MTAVRRVSSAARWAKTMSGFSLVLGATAAVGHRYGMVDTAAYLWVLAIVAGLAVLGMLLAAIGFQRLWAYGDKAGKSSLAALFLSCLVLAPFAAGAYLWFHYPPLTDVSTDLEEPPSFVQALRTRNREMNAITPLTPERMALQREAYPDVAGRRLEASMERALQAVDAVIEARGWARAHRLATSEGGLPELLLEYQAPTFFVRFPADAVVRMTDEGESVFVDMRMSNRYGAHDLGDNARRIASFMNDLDATFARQSLSIIDIPASGEEENAVE